MLLKKTEEIVTPLPEGIFVEITNVCNFKCEFCPSSFSKRPYGFMEFGLFKKIVDEFKEAGGEYINLWMLGEPFIHPEVLEFINYVENSGLWTAVITNGSLVGEKREVFERLLSDFKHIIVNISYYGATEEIFNLTKAKKLDLPAYRSGINWFIEKQIKNNNRPAININILINRYNGLFEKMPTVDNVDGIISEWNSYFKTLKDKYNINEKICYLKKTEVLRGLRKNGCYELETLPNIKSHFTWAMDWTKTFMPRGIKMIPRKYGSCTAPYNSLVVLWDGDCVICCTDYDGCNKIGNVKDNRLLDIWNGQEIKKIRDAMHRYSLILPFCQQCKALPLSTVINHRTVNYIVKFYFGSLHLKVRKMAKGNI